MPSVAHAVALDLRPGGPPAWDLEPPAITLYLWRPELGLVAHQLAVGVFEARLVHLAVNRRHFVAGGARRRRRPGGRLHHPRRRVAEGALHHR